MMFIVAASILVLLILLAQNRYKPAVLFFGVSTLYYFLGLINLDAMLKNFINQSLVTLVLLILISIALEKTSFLSTLSEKLFSASFHGSLFRMNFFTLFASAFLNNTAVVVSMIGVIKQNKRHSASKLLLPLSYAAIFGGVITLVGTSTNLIVNGFMIERGLQGFEIFDFAYVGLPLAIVCSFVLHFVVKFLPEGNPSDEIQVQSYFIEAKVKKGSKLIGKSIKENGLRRLEYLFLSEILRDGRIISPVSPGETLREHDILIFSGDVREIALLKKFDGLELENHRHNLSFNLVEAIISHESSLVGKALKSSSFRTKFDASVVAIKRGDEKLSGKIGEITLQAGDSLILAIGDDFHQRDNLAKNFYFINQINLQDRLTRNQSLFVMLAFIGVIAGGALKLFPLVKGLFGLLVLFLIFGFVRAAEIKRRFPYELILIIGSALGISAVIISSGLATGISQVLQYLFGGLGVYGAFLSVYLVTLILTEIITNNAAAALAFPIGYSTSVALDANLMPFAMAVAYGASASFMTPFGYQTNLMVASVGGYGFKTFLKSGIFVSVVYSAMALTLIPIFFPF